jgi:hypothetical protein
MTESLWFRETSTNKNGPPFLATHLNSNLIEVVGGGER